MENTTVSTEITTTPAEDSMKEPAKAPDSPLLQNMKEHFTWFYKTACLYALIYTFCFYDNPEGITYPIGVAVFILFSILWIRKAGMSVKKNLVFYFGGMMLLGISTCLTKNNGIQIFNKMGIVLLFCVAMLHQMYEDGSWNLPAYLKQMLIFAGTCIGSLFKPIEHMLYYFSKRKPKKDSQVKKQMKKQAPPILTGVAIAGLFLLCVLPLLIGSDQVFARCFQFSFSLPDFDFSAWMQLFFCFLTGFLMLYVSFAALFRQNLKDGAVKEGNGANALTGITFTAILAFTYVIYSGIQILFLFLRRGLPDGMTYSQYAHQGFWQLLTVCLINLVTVLVCVQVFEKHSVLNVLLLVISVCTCVMIVSAAYRMLLYVGVYHLTFLRILVLWFLGVLALIMWGVMVSIFREEFHLFQYIVAVMTCGYILFSYAGVDRIIASYNLEHAESVSWQDVTYVLYGLSEDAAPYVEKLAEMDIEKYVVTGDDYYYYRDHPFDEEESQKFLASCETVGEYLEPEFLAYMERIANRDEVSLRKWNFAEARARKAAEKYLQKYFEIF